MGFTTELVAQQTGDFDWKVVEPLVYTGRVDTFTVPAGSDTDFASVPEIFQWLIPRSGRYTKPAVLHDFLCRHGTEVGCPVEDADGLFRRSMADVGVPFFTRWIMWTAVRWRSLLKSWFRAGPIDLVQMLPITIVPGLFVLAGGLAVVGLLLVWFFAECVATAVIGLLKAVAPKSVESRMKETVAPKLPWAT